MVANGFRSTLRDSRISEYRIDEMIKLIEELNNREHVFLVRLPVSETIFEIENEFYPGFDSLIESIASTNTIAFFNMQHLQGEMVFNDGHHINRSYAPKCTALIALWIKQHGTQNAN